MIVAKYQDETLRVLGNFTDATGAAVDPTVTAGVIKADGSVAEITPTDETGTGAWSAKYDLATNDPVGKYVVWMKGAITGFDVMARVVFNVSAVAA